MTALDPRLAPVLARKRTAGRGMALLGLGFLLVGSMSVVGSASKSFNGSTPAVWAICFFMLLLPGFLMVLAWLRGPERTRLVRLLSEDRAKLASWSLAYVSENGGPTRSRITLSLRTRGYEQVMLSHADAAGVIAYLCEEVPGATRKNE